MRKTVPYLVSGAIFIAIGLCMLLSPVSLGTLAIALVAIYIECEGIRSLLVTRKEYGPRWLFILITTKNAMLIISGIALLVLIFALPSLLFSLFVFIAGALLMMIAAVNTIQYFATGRHYLSPGTLISFALGIVLILYPFIMSKPGFRVAAAFVLALGTAAFTAGMMRLRLASDISSVLLELGARDGIRVSDVADAMDRKLMHSVSEKGKSIIKRGNAGL